MWPKIKKSCFLSKAGYKTTWICFHTSYIHPLSFSSLSPAWILQIGESYKFVSTHKKIFFFLFFYQTSEWFLVSFGSQRHVRIWLKPWNLCSQKCVSRNPDLKSYRDLVKNLSFLNLVQFESILLLLFLFLIWGKIKWIGSFLHIQV